MNLNNKKVIVIFLSFIIIGVTLFGFGFAKYKTSVSFETNVTYSTKLAQTISLVESKAIRQEDGSYMLDSNKVNNNTYKVMPGVDIPKNPMIIVEGKTDVPAYLFIEVVENVPNAVEYTIQSEWKSLGIKGPNGGDVYVYQSLVLDRSNCPDNISVLAGNLLIVSDTYRNDTADFSMDIYAYMSQVVESDTPTTSFNNAFMNGGD